MVQKFSELMKDTNLKFQKIHTISIKNKKYSRYAMVIFWKIKHKEKNNLNEAKRERKKNDKLPSSGSI